MTAASVLLAAATTATTGAGPRDVSVFDGGPDTLSTATGLDLEVGP